MYCEKCGKNTSSDDVFCKHCGAKIVAPKRGGKKKPTLADLSETMWYRTLKVIYVIVFIVLTLFAITITDWSVAPFYEKILYPLVMAAEVLIVLEVIKRVFYFIILGTIVPGNKK